MGGQNHETEIKKESVATEENKATETVVETSQEKVESNTEEVASEVTEEVKSETPAQG